MMLKDRVAVVTGSGRGIGRGMALLMAKEGAKVVVNDLGGAEDGTGSDQAVASQVAKEITDAGGTAVANFDSVATWDGGHNIIQTAIDNFGKIDILVNNAGVLRDRMIFNMTEEEWDGVMAVHLKGAFNCTRAASNYMKQQKYGRVINFSSTSGLLGNYGQSNYGAAKLGLVGFTRNCALDMQRYGVTFNAIAPFAWTRLIGPIPASTTSLNGSGAAVRNGAIASFIVSMTPEAEAAFSPTHGSDAGCEARGNTRDKWPGSSR